MLHLSNAPFSERKSALVKKVGINLKPESAFPLIFKFVMVSKFIPTYLELKMTCESKKIMNFNKLNLTNSQRKI